MKSFEVACHWMSGARRREFCAESAELRALWRSWGGGNPTGSPEPRAGWIVEWNGDAIVSVGRRGKSGEILAKPDGSFVRVVHRELDFNIDSWNKFGLRPLLLDLEQVASISRAALWRPVGHSAHAPRLTFRWGRGVPAHDFWLLPFVRNLVKPCEELQAAACFEAVTLEGGELWLHRKPEGRKERCDEALR